MIYLTHRIDDFLTNMGVALPAAMTYTPRLHQKKGALPE